MLLFVFSSRVNLIERNFEVNDSRKAFVERLLVLKALKISLTYVIQICDEYTKVFLIRSVSN